MGFFKSIFGQDDDQLEYNDSYDYDNDYDDDIDLDDDDDKIDLDDYNDDSSDSSDSSYSIAKVHVVGFDQLDEADKDYIRDCLEEDTHVYFRYDFNNPNPKQALQVLRHSYILGYVEPSKAEIVHKYLRESKIGAIVVSKIKSKNFTISIDLNVYYEDPHGEEYLPYYPIEGRKLSVYEVDKWTGQEDWSKDWHLNLRTDELCYKYRNMYDSTIDDDESLHIDMDFDGFVRNYLDGTCITKKGSERSHYFVNTECAKKVLWKRIESYMESKDYHFADKELFSDDDEDVPENEDETIVTGRGFTIPAKFQKFSATADATEYNIDFFEMDDWQENDIPIVMASITPGEEIAAINLESQDLYFYYRCKEIESKMKEGYYAIVIVTDYAIKNDIIEVELYAQFSEADNSNSYGEVVKQYATTYELDYIDGQDHHQRKVIKNANMNSFVAGIKFRDNYEELLAKLEEGMELQIRPEPDNEFDPDALAVYNGNDHLGYIPKKDIPAVALNIEDDCAVAEIDYVDEEHIDLVVPVSFESLLEMSDEELEGFRFYKTERTKYETGYVENSSPISKEEFVEGIRQQKEN